MNQEPQNRESGGVPAITTNTSPAVIIVTREDGSKVALPRFRWNAARRHAIELLVEGRLKKVEIAEQCGVNTAQLAKWQEHPEFQAELERAAKEYARAVRACGIAILERRIASYIHDWERTEKILRERGRKLGAEDPDAGGADTGYICRDYKGKDADRAVYRFDAALYRERREIRKQLAQELGQWQEKESGGADKLREIAAMVRSQPLTVGPEDASE